MFYCTARLVQYTTKIVLLHSQVGTVYYKDCSIAQPGWYSVLQRLFYCTAWLVQCTTKIVLLHSQDGTVYYKDCSIAQLGWYIILQRLYYCTASTLTPSPVMTGSVHSMWITVGGVYFNTWPEPAIWQLLNLTACYHVTGLYRAQSGKSFEPMNKWMLNSTPAKERKEIFYLMWFSTHFIYGYIVLDMVKDHSFWYEPIHSQDSTYHDLCYTSRGALAGTRNSSMGPPWRIDPMIIHTHTYIHTYLPTYLPIYLPTYLPTYIHNAYIHTYMNLLFTKLNNCKLKIAPLSQSATTAYLYNTIAYMYSTTAC